MQTLRRTVAILTFPAIAYLGDACERTDTPTAVTAVPFTGAVAYATPTRWVNYVDPTPLNGYSPPGTSCNDPGHQTIQAAVNAASAGEIIMVCAGTYPELLTGTLTISKTLTLLGAQNTMDARNPRGPESIITDMSGTSVSASNVIIDGFTIENSTAANPGFGIWLNPGVSGTQILNNIIQNNIVGIGLANGSGAQAVIRQNLFRNNNVPGAAEGQGIYTDQFVGGTVRNVLIEENAFIGNTVAGIDVSNTDPAGGAFNLDISTNSFNLNGRAFILYNTHMSSFHDNSVTNSTTAADNPVSATLRILDNNTDLSIMNNNLTTGTAHAIRLSFFGDVGGPSSGVVINENNIGVVGSANFVLDGLLVDPGSHVGTVNAKCNWWGSNTGPTNPNNTGGTGEEVVGDADFTPWLTAPAPGGPCIGGVPSGKVTGGGQVQVNMTGGKGTFGFNAKNEAGVGGSGHLNYLNHATRSHLDCTVTVVTVLTATTAEFSGPCSPNSAATSFKAHVEDNGKPGKRNDKFKITYTDQFGPHVDEGGPGPIISGNIEIH